MQRCLLSDQIASPVFGDAPAPRVARSVGRAAIKKRKNNNNNNNNGIFRLERSFVRPPGPLPLSSWYDRTAYASRIDWHQRPGRLVSNVQ